MENTELETELVAAEVIAILLVVTELLDTEPANAELDVLLDVAELIGTLLGAAVLVDATAVSTELKAPLVVAELVRILLVADEVGDVGVVDRRLGDAELTVTELVGREVASGELGGTELVEAAMMDEKLTDAALLDIEFVDAEFVSMELVGIEVVDAELVVPELIIAELMAIELVGGLADARLVVNRLREELVEREMREDVCTELEGLELEELDDNCTVLELCKEELDIKLVVLDTRVDEKADEIAEVGLLLGAIATLDGELTIELEEDDCDSVELGVVDDGTVNEDSEMLLKVAELMGEELV